MKRGTPDHPKTEALASLLRIGKAQAVGHLEMLWHFAAKYAIQGNIGKWDDAQIAQRCGWESANGEAPSFVEALVTAGWLDRCKEHRLLIHHWKDHCEQSVKKTLINNSLPFLEVSRKVRKDKPSSGCGEATAKAVGKALYSEGFARFWKAWPRHFRKTGKGRAAEKWHSLDLECQAEDVVAVVEVMKTSRSWMKEGGQYIPAPVVWLNAKGYDCEIEDLAAAPSNSDTPLLTAGARRNQAKIAELAAQAAEEKP